MPTTSIISNPVREVTSATLPVMPPLFDFIQHNSMDDFNRHARSPQPNFSIDENQNRFHFN